MALDKKIAEAIRESVKTGGQSTKVADRLIAWFDSLTTGTETLGDPSTTNRHLTDLFEIVEPSDKEGNE
jgi:CxC ATPase-based modification system component